jgi:hypothetical protein
MPKRRIIDLPYLSGVSSAVYLNLHCETTNLKRPQLCLQNPPVVRIFRLNPQRPSRSFLPFRRLLQRRRKLFAVDVNK